MSDNTMCVLLVFIFFGWIPILSMCKGICWVIETREECKKDECEVISDEEV